MQIHLFSGYYMKVLRQLPFKQPSAETLNNIFIFLLTYSSISTNAI